jgi:hypothetical protein
MGIKSDPLFPTFKFITTNDWRSIGEPRTMKFSAVKSIDAMDMTEVMPSTSEPNKIPEVVSMVEAIYKVEGYGRGQVVFRFQYRCEEEQHNE